MKGFLAFTSKVFGGLSIVRPTRQEIEALKVGDIAQDCFGNFVPVTSITYRGEDVNGKLFVGCYVKLGKSPAAQISCSFKEGEIDPTMPLIEAFSRVESIDFDRMPGEAVSRREVWLANYGD